MIIEVKDLSKIFVSPLLRKKREVLKNISFSVEKGIITGFLGHNGAGKTTTLKIIMGFLKPTAGYVKIKGKSPDDVEIKKIIGFVPENPVFYKKLTGKEILYITGNMFDLDYRTIKKRTDMLLSVVGLGDKGDIPVGKYSKGMLQRLGMAQALMNDPEILILDEPLSGLDPVGRKEIRDLIVMQKERGKTVLFSTHILHDLEMIADKIVMIVKGEVKKEGFIDDIIEDKIDTIEIKFVPPTNNKDKIIEIVKEKSDKLLNRGNLFIAIFSDEESSKEILRFLIESEADIESYTPQEISLEKYFLEEVKEI